MLIQPYLSFEGRCEEALEFYGKALGARVLMLTRFKDSPDQSMISPGMGEKVMHAAIRIDESILLASDGRCTGQIKFHGLSLSLEVKDDAEAQQRFAALADGGEVHMPLTRTFFSSQFGMVADRFGVMWMVSVAA